MRAQNDYWFPAKRHGWGWGPPRVWQGWAALGLFTCLLVVCAVVVLPRHGALAFVACTSALAALLTWVCWLTGEPPKWRWTDE